MASYYELRMIIAEEEALTRQLSEIRLKKEDMLLNLWKLKVLRDL